jgi:hypothetical protein
MTFLPRKAVCQGYAEQRWSASCCLGLTARFGRVAGDPRLEERAEIVTDEKIRSALIGVAQQWRDLAQDAGRHEPGPHLIAYER